MEDRKPDALLTAARVLVIIGKVIAITVAVILALVMVALLVRQGDVMAQLAEQGIKAEGWEVLTAIELVLGTATAMLIMAYEWLKALLAMIDSVSLGDPFVPENADRLTRMGWLTIAINVVAIPAGGIAAWLAANVKDADADFGFSIGGILLALVLFILARVFRQGAAMRQDLEETV